MFRLLLLLVATDAARGRGRRRERDDREPVLEIEKKLRRSCAVRLGLFCAFLFRGQNSRLAVWRTFVGTERCGGWGRGGHRWQRQGGGQKTEKKKRDAKYITRLPIDAESTRVSVRTPN